MNLDLPADQIASRGEVRASLDDALTPEPRETLPPKAPETILRRELREPYWAGKTRRVN